MSRLQDAAPRTPVIGVETTTVSQKGKAFLPARVRVLAGSTLTIINDDTRTHNIRIYDPRLDVNTGAQEPGEVATVVFTTPGTFEAICGIHPTMRLTIEVAPVAARK